MFCKKLMVSLISMTAVCGMGIAAPSVRATTSPNTVDTAARAGTLRVPTTKSATISSDTTSVRNNDATDVNSRMAYVSGSVGGKLSTKLQQPAPASASALSELERKVRELTDLNAEELNTLRSELGGKLDTEDFAEHFDTRATEKDLVDSTTVSSVYATKEELSSVPTSLAFSELTGRVDDAAADIQTLNTELNRKLDKDTADGSYATIAALQGVKNTADSAVTPAMLSTELTSYAKVEDLENIPSSEAFTSLTGRVGTAEGKITTLQSDLAGKANAGDSYTKSESDAQLQAAKDYADSQISNIEIPNPDLTNYYSKDETYNKTEVSNAIATAKAGATADAKTYADDTFALKSAVEGKANASDVNSLTGRVGAAEQIITALQTGKANVGDVYTKSEVDDAIDNAVIGGQVDLSGYYKKTETYDQAQIDSAIAAAKTGATADAKTYADDTFALKSALNNYDTSAQTDAKIQAATTGLASETFASQQAAGALSSAQAYTNEKFNSIEIPEVDLTNYYTKDETYTQAQIDSAIATAKTNAMDYADDTFALKSAVDAKANASDVNALTGRVGTAEENITALQTGKANVGDVYTKAEVDEAIDGAVTGGQVDLSGYYKKTETYSKEESNALLADKASASDLTTLSNKVNDTETGLDTKLSAATAAENYVLKSALNDYDTSAQTTAKIQAATTGLASETFASQQAAGALSSAQAYTNEKFNSIEIPDVDLSDYYKSQQVDTLLANKVNVGDVYTKTQVDDKIDDAITGGQVDLSGYYKKTETYSKEESNALLANKASASDVNSLTTRVGTAEGDITALQTATAGHTSAISDINTALTNKLGVNEAANTYALKSALNDLASTEYVDNKVSDKVTTTQLNNVLADYDTSAQTTAKIQTATAGLATTGYVDEQISNIDIPDPDLSEYYKSQQVDTLLAGKLDNDALDDYDTSAQTTAKIQTATAGLATTGYVDNKVSDKVTTTQLNTALSDKVTTNQFNTALSTKLDSSTAANTYATKTALQGVQTTAEAAVTPTELSDTLSTYATKSYVDSQAPNVELDYDSDENALVYRNSPTDQWRYIPIAGLQGAPGVTPLLEANDARQAIRVSYDNGQTYTTLVPYETIKGPKGDKGDPGCDDFEVQTEETEGGSRISVICVKND